MDKLNAVMRNKVSRRKFISGVGAGVGAAAAVSLAAGCGGGSSTTTAPTTVAATGVTDFDILNFALNLEYLEAEFYLRAVTGNGLATANIGGSPGTVTGGSQVPWTIPAIQQYATETAQEEEQHVIFLRAAITSLGGIPVDRPTIDFTDAFNTAASAAGIGSSFNPFDSDQDFVLGSFTFEDVGVTAYNGAAGLITQDANYSTVLTAAGSIVAVEAYHAGSVRTIIAGLGATYIGLANQISTLRGTASAAASGGNAAETPLSVTSIVAANSMSLAYNRTTDQVLHIVYLNPMPGVTTKGGFFPNGMNGTITASAS
jgi:hypothetical protein